MQEFTLPPVEGHFHLECLDKNDNVLDIFDDHNMIMTSARQSMSEIFAKLDTSTYANRVVLGNLGNITGNILKAKTEAEGFVKTRTSLFSEVPSTVYKSGDMLEVINLGDIIKYNLDGGMTENYKLYEYTAESSTNVVLSNTIIQNNFSEVSTVPYTYEIPFELPGHSMTSEENCVTGETTDQVYVATKDTSIVFNFVIDTENANNGQHNVEDYDTPTSIFNEAAIYVNGRIFCMKCFPSKFKDLTVKLKIIWTITF